MGWTGNDEGLRSSRDLQLEQSLGAVLHRTSVDRLHLVKVGHVCRLQQVNRGGTAHVLDQQEITKVKKVCSNVAQSPVHQTTQSTLHFTPWQTCSFQRQRYLSGKHSATLQLLREDYLCTY